MHQALMNSASDFCGPGQFNVNALRPYINKNGEARVAVNSKRSIATNAALLQYQEWLDIDRKVVEIATQRLVAYTDLISKGLTHTLGSIGQTVSLWDKSSDLTPANISMSGVTAGEQDTPAFLTSQVPVPIIHKDFRINLRRLEASRTFGESIDTTSASLAARVVAEKSEDLLFSGSAIKVEGGTIYGYLNHPDRNTASITGAWTGLTGAQILADVQTMLTAARADLYFGPYTLYIPGTYETKLDDDYKAGADAGDTRTIRERIMALSGIEAIQVADRMPADNVLLVQLTSDVVDLAIAQDINTVQWETNGGMIQNFKVMAIWTPRVKSDYDGRSGIVHMS